VRPAQLAELNDKWIAHALLLKNQLVETNAVLGEEARGTEHFTVQATVNADARLST
jgi:hypothetical protein